jgi:hypothetical protein
MKSKYMVPKATREAQRQRFIHKLKAAPIRKIHKGGDSKRFRRTEDISTFSFGNLRKKSMTKMVQPIPEAKRSFTRIHTKRCHSGVSKFPFHFGLNLSVNC